MRRTCVGRWAGCATLCAVYACATVNAQDLQSDVVQPNDDAVTVSDDGTVQLHVADMPLATVLRMLNVRGRRNIIATPSVQGTVTADIYNATFEQALRAVLIANGCDYEVGDDFINVYTLDELAVLRADTTPIPHRVFWLNYVNASEVESVVQPLLSEEGKIARSSSAQAGIAVSAQSFVGDAPAGRDFIVVYDYLDRLARIAMLIKETDVQPAQVLVEATILRARLTEDNALGVDFSLLGGVDLAMLGSASSGIQDISFGELPVERFEKFNSNVTTDFTGNVPDGGVTIGIIKDHVAVFLRALEQITDVSVIANPKVLALNKQTGNLIVGRRDGYLTTTVTETQAIQKVEFLETGTQLTFRPFIGTDGYVRMELHPKDSVGGLTAAQLPFEQTTEVKTTVFVRDGHTILIGGLFREVSSQSRAQIPLLGDLPKVGNLFRSRSDSLDREEVIILLTVHIIKNDAAYARYSAEQLEDLERMRVELRRSMMWHGRDRLAQSYYRKALESFAQGRHERALWNVQSALRNQPRFLSAIKLKEEIEQVREWDDDGSITRAFIWELIMREQGVEEPRFGRESPPPEREKNSDKAVGPTFESVEDG